MTTKSTKATLGTYREAELRTDFTRRHQVVFNREELERQGVEVEVDSSGNIGLSGSRGLPDEVFEDVRAVADQIGLDHIGLEEVMATIADQSLWSCLRRCSRR